MIRAAARRFIWLVMIAVLVYGGGFGMFVVMLPKPFVGIPPLDGLVVFTGGSNRVAAGLNALQNGFGGQVLISGVHPDVKINELPGAQSLDEATRQRITLDYAADTTHRNVDQTLAWAEMHNLRRIGVVTSTYHTLRSRLLFWLQGGNLNVVMLPVQPGDTGVRFLWREYNKLLVAPLLR